MTKYQRALTAYIMEDLQNFYSYSSHPLSSQWKQTTDRIQKEQDHSLATTMHHTIRTDDFLAVGWNRWRNEHSQNA